MNGTIRRSDPCGDYELLQRVGTGLLYFPYPEIQNFSRLLW